MIFARYNLQYVIKALNLLRVFHSIRFKVNKVIRL